MKQPPQLINLITIFLHFVGTYYQFWIKINYPNLGHLSICFLGVSGVNIHIVLYSLIIYMFLYHLHVCYYLDQLANISYAVNTLFWPITLKRNQFMTWKCQFFKPKTSSIFISSLGKLHNSKWINCGLIVDFRFWQYFTCAWSFRKNDFLIGANAVRAHARCVCEGGRSGH